MSLDQDSKVCPQCAETVKTAAEVCRYCGHEFNQPIDALSVEAPAPPTVEVFRCPSCAKPTPEKEGRCRHCRTEFAVSTPQTSSSGATPTEPPSFAGRTFDISGGALWGCGGLVLLFVVIVGLLVSYCSNRRAEQAAEDAAQAAAEAKERQVAYDKSVKDGSVCADGWGGSNLEFVDAVKRRLRDPDSFEHVATVIQPRNSEGQYPALMQYRAKNGFGGYNVGGAHARLRLVARRDCRVVSVALLTN